MNQLPATLPQRSTARSGQCYSVDGLPPSPARVWSRVQGTCAEPLPVNSTISNIALPNYVQMKGNVLQYKKNSSNLTSKQRYAQIAKGKWVSRSKTFASQTITTTIPNTKGLLRVNYTTIYADDGTTAYGKPVTCPEPPGPPVIPPALPFRPPPSTENDVYPQPPPPPPPTIEEILLQSENTPVPVATPVPEATPQPVPPVPEDVPVVTPVPEAIPQPVPSPVEPVPVPDTDANSAEGEADAEAETEPESSSGLPTSSPYVPMVTSETGPTGEPDPVPEYILIMQASLMIIEDSEMTSEIGPDGLPTDHIPDPDDDVPADEQCVLYDPAITPETGPDGSPIDSVPDPDNDVPTDEHCVLYDPAITPESGPPGDPLSCLDNRYLLVCPEDVYYPEVTPESGPVDPSKPPVINPVPTPITHAEMIDALQPYSNYNCGANGLPEPPIPSKYSVKNSEQDPSYPRLCPQYVNPADLVEPIPIEPIPPTLPPRFAPPGPILDLPYLNPVPPPPEREVIADGGNFICVHQDICEAAENPGEQPPLDAPNYCNPTSASNVPGPIRVLCYNSLANKTYYPRRRYKMTNSANKFPTGYKFMM